MADDYANAESNAMADDYANGYANADSYANADGYANADTLILSLDSSRLCGVR